MLYILYGPDSFSRREALQKLKAELDQDGMLETNTTVLDASQTSPQEVIAACGAIPFLGSRRLVIVEGVFQQGEQGARGRRPTKRESGAEDSRGTWQALVNYIDEMPETTALVLVDGKVDSANALLESLRDKGKMSHFPALTDDALRRWTQQRAEAFGIKVESAARRLLVQLVGGQREAGDRPYVDTWTLASELDKLAAYAGGRAVREDDVRLLVSAAREQKGYLLADAVADGRPAVAVRLLYELRTQAVADQVLLATIESRYRRLGVAREMLDAGASDRSVGQRLGLKPGFATERCIEQAQRYSASGIRAAFARIVQADADIKLGVYDEALSLELLINDLSLSRSARAA